MKLLLRDKNPLMVKAWEAEFRNLPNVTVECCDIFDPIPHLGKVALVSPANSFGFMNGGIDAVYIRHFGPELQTRLQNTIQPSGVGYYGEIPVGQAVAIYIDDLNKGFNLLISAPTMRVPTDVTGTINAYLAFRAALIEADIHWVENLICPGLCTFIGRMPVEIAAHQMREAYAVVVEGKKLFANTISQAYHANECLRRGVSYAGEDF